MGLTCARSRRSSCGRAPGVASVAVRSLRPGEFPPKLRRAEGFAGNSSGGFGRSVGSPAPRMDAGEGFRRRRSPRHSEAHSRPRIAIDTPNQVGPPGARPPRRERSLTAALSSRSRRDCVRGLGSPSMELGELGARPFCLID